MYMKDWLETIDDYLKMTRRNILTTNGKISHKQAVDKAHAEYENGVFLSEQDIRIAKENGFAVVTGYSDDIINISGSMQDKTDCWIGPDNDKPKRVFVDKNGFTEKETPWYIDIYRYRGYASWEYETNIPCEKFKIYEDDELYCIGLVFDVRSILR